MAKVEGRYLGTEHSDDGVESEEDEGRSDEGNRNSEWFDWTSNLVFLADKLNRDVDKITGMPYVAFLFWTNYFKLKIEQDYINSKG